jgi:hypothetical protein
VTPGNGVVFGMHDPDTGEFEPLYMSRLTAETLRDELNMIVEDTALKLQGIKV